MKKFKHGCSDNQQKPTLARLRSAEYGKPKMDEGKPDPRTRARQFCTRLSTSIADLARDCEKTSTLGYNESFAVQNLTLFVFLLQRDVVILRDELAFATGKDRQDLMARHLALTIYEACEDIPQLLGQEYRKTMLALGMTDEGLKHLGQISRGFHQFGEANRSFLARIRNYVVAHRDHDGRRQLAILAELDPKAVLILTIEFSRLLLRVVAWQSQVLKTVIGNHTKNHETKGIYGCQQSAAPPPLTT